MVDEGETSGETGEEEEEKEEDPNVENNASTQTDPEDYSGSSECVVALFSTFGSPSFSSSSSPVSPEVSPSSTM